MSELADHLNDHLGGSVTGAGLAKHLRSEYEGEPLGELAAKLEREIEEDRDTLKDMIEKLGGSPSNLKQAGGWLADRAAILIRERGTDPHSRLSMLDALSVGIEGKAMLWRSLQAVAPSQLGGHDLDELEQRALQQRSELEPYRIAAARQLAEEDARP